MSDDHQTPNNTAGLCDDHSRMTNKSCEIKFHWGPLITILRYIGSEKQEMTGIPCRIISKE